MVNRQDEQQGDIVRLFETICALAAVLALVTNVRASDSGILYGVDGTSNQFLVLDPSTGAGSIVGETGLEFPNDDVFDLAYDTSTETLFGIARGSRLVTIDRSTGVGTPVGTVFTSSSSLFSLAYDPRTDSLLTANSRSDVLYEVDRTTGQATAVGSIAVAGNVLGLGYDLSTDTLYGVANLTVGSSDFIRIDRSTGVGTVIGPTGLHQPVDLAYDPVTDTLFGVDFRTDQLLTIDRSTGLATAIGPSGLDSPVFGIEFIPASVPEPTSFVLLGCGAGVMILRRRRTELA